MKKYCFNYSVVGTHTFLPVFVCVEAKNKFVAYVLCKRYLQKKNEGSKVKIWLKNYPDMVDKEFQTTRIPNIK